ncbi:MAG TPA: acylneuraminate cytidylyltransferase family protein, partial [bacterium]|nr:acylneuraminate cytidylyltransferase family protein [bacterium]
MKSGVIAIIPARGGSKGVPRKNVRLLGGRPLIAHSIEAALQANCVDRVVVSTDDEEIAQVALNAGAEIPFMRPPELALDHIPVMPVIQELMRKVDPQQ